MRFEEEELAAASHHRLSTTAIESITLLCTSAYGFTSPAPRMPPPVAGI
jgi:hypothetical protein